MQSFSIHLIVHTRPFRLFEDRFLYISFLIQ